LSNTQSKPHDHIMSPAQKQSLPGVLTQQWTGALLVGTTSPSSAPLQLLKMASVEEKDCF
jgi:hypothetical protein